MIFTKTGEPVGVALHELVLATHDPLSRAYARKVERLQQLDSHRRPRAARQVVRINAPDFPIAAGPHNPMRPGADVPRGERKLRDDGTPRRRPNWIAGARRASGKPVEVYRGTDPAIARAFGFTERRLIQSPHTGIPMPVLGFGEGPLF